VYSVWVIRAETQLEKGLAWDGGLSGGLLAAGLLDSWTLGKPRARLGAGTQHSYFVRCGVGTPYSVLYTTPYTATALRKHKP
jgi:hypothetical protein